MTNLLAGVTGEMVLALHLLVRTRETLRNNLIQEPVMGKEIRMWHKIYLIKSFGVLEWKFKKHEGAIFSGPQIIRWTSCVDKFYLHFRPFFGSHEVYEKVAEVSYDDLISLSLGNAMPQLI